MCVCFKRNCLGLQQFLPPTQSPLVFAGRNCGDLPISSWHWDPGLGTLVWGWDSSLPRCPSLYMCILYMWVWGQPVPRLRPSSSLGGCGFCNSVVVRLPFNSISDGSEGWLFYSLVVILMWLCDEANHVYLCRHLDQRSESVIFLNHHTV